MPVFAAMVFHGGSNALAMLMSAAGIGALIGSFAMSSSRVQSQLQVVIIVGCVGVTIALLMIGSSTNILTLKVNIISIRDGYNVLLG